MLSITPLDVTCDEICSGIEILNRKSCDATGNVAALKQLGKQKNHSVPKLSLMVR